MKNKEKNIAFIFSFLFSVGFIGVFALLSAF